MSPSPTVQERGRRMTREPKPRRNDTSVKMDAELVHKAKIVAAYRGQSIAEYLSERFGALIESDLSRHQREAKRDSKRENDD